MIIFKIKWFNQWVIKVKITDNELLQAIREIEKDLIDARLEEHVYKKRLGFQGKGKRGGARTLIAFKSKNRAFFIYGFTKNQQDNINQRELSALKRLAKALLQYDDHELKEAIIAGELIEVLGYE